MPCFLYCNGYFNTFLDLFGSSNVVDLLRTYLDLFGDVGVSADLFLHHAFLRGQLVSSDVEWVEGAGEQGHSAE